MQEFKEIWNDFVDSPLFSMFVTAIIWFIIFSVAVFLFEVSK